MPLCQTLLPLRKFYCRTTSPRLFRRSYRTFAHPHLHLPCHSTISCLPECSTFITGPYIHQLSSLTLVNLWLIFQSISAIQQTRFSHRCAKFLLVSIKPFTSLHHVWKFFSKKFIQGSVPMSSRYRFPTEFTTWTIYEFLHSHEKVSFPASINTILTAWLPVIHISIRVEHILSFTIPSSSLWKSLRPGTRTIC